MKKHHVILSLMLCAGLMMLAAGTIFAGESASQAKNTLEKAVNKITPILLKSEFKDKNTRKPYVDQIEKIVFTVFDFNEFSARTVGVKWRSFTDTQKKNFQDGFSDLLYQTYLSALLNYSGQKINYINELVSTAGDKVEVQTTIPNQDKSIPVNYRMIKKPDGWKVYDVIVENVGMVQNYRNQFQEVLARQTPEQLIEMIKQKAAEAKAKNDSANL